MRRKKLPVARIRTYALGKQFPSHLMPYLPRMREIYHQLFDVESDYDLNNLLKYRGEEIRLGMFFDKNNQLCGFAISGIHTVTVHGQTHALFSAGAYADLNYNAASSVVKFALTQSIRYKLKHPYHKLAYLEEALTPAPYSLSSRILPECYPSPDKKAPPVINEIIQAIKQKRGYIFTDASEWVVRFSGKRRLKDYQRILNSKLRTTCRYYQHYFELNPNFINGDALLVYMPLSFKHILLALGNLLNSRKH